MSAVNRDKKGEINLRISIVGDCASGKTSLFFRYVKQDVGDVTPSFAPTPLCQRTVVDGVHLYLEIIDIPGTDLYRRQYPAELFLHNAGIIICGFDVTKRDTLNVCDWWIKQIQEKIIIRDFDGIIIAVGNKNDLHDKREISFEEAKEHFSAMNIPYYETSAKTGEGVVEAFEGPISLWLQQCLKTNENEDSSEDSQQDSSDGGLLGKLKNSFHRKKG